MRNLFLNTAAAVSLGLLSLPAHAAFTAIPFDGTDCSGGAFANCWASETGTGTSTLLPDGASPSIYKRNSGINNTPTGAEAFGNFGTIDGTEFAITYIGGASNILQWTYTPGTGDPNVLYFTIKQANKYVLFFDAGGPTPIFSGSIALSPHFAQPGWSHITFFDSGRTPPPSVTEPATIGLLGAGLLGLAALRRRKRS
jgi:hypothetical protein